MAAQNAARAAPAEDAGHGPQGIARLPGTPFSPIAQPHEQRRTEADRRVFLERVQAIGHEGAHAAVALQVGATLASPHLIERSADDFVSVARNLRNTIDSALAYGLDREAIAEAAREYRAQRGEAGTVVRRDERARPTHAARGTGDAPSETTRAKREAMQRDFPDAYKHGARAGFTRANKCPEDFHTWPEAKRSAWFSGYNHGRCDCQRLAAITPRGNVDGRATP